MFTLARELLENSTAPGYCEMRNREAKKTKENASPPLFLSHCYMIQFQDRDRKIIITRSQIISLHHQPINDQGNN